MRRDGDHSPPGREALAAWIEPLVNHDGPIRVAFWNARARRCRESIQDAEGSCLMLHDARFRRFWAAQVISEAGSGVGAVAMPLTAVLTR